MLVIDDNEYQSKYIADLLADVKAKAVAVSSGEAALDLLSDEATATFVSRARAAAAIRQASNEAEGTGELPEPFGTA